MHARSTTITGDPAALDTAIAFITDEVMPAVTAMQGCVGLSLVVDREHGRAIVTSSWHDLGAMQASDEQLVDLRARGGEILGGQPQVDEWEVALMHRDHTAHEGSCCRITWARSRDLDRTAEGWRDQMLPRVEQLPGFCSASLLLDRDGGRGCVTVSFDSRAELEATREAATGMRAQAEETLGAQILEHAEFELVIHHLRIPELV